VASPTLCLSAAGRQNQNAKGGAASAAARCPRNLGTIVKAQEIQFHNEVYNQFLEPVLAAL